MVNGAQAEAGPGPRAGTEWRFEAAPVPYPDAVQRMEQRLEALRRERAPELAWFLEHPALYTAGTSARTEDLLQPARLPVYRSGRGGQFTYHGPGQRVVYLVVDLKRRGSDLRAYVSALEQSVIDTLAQFGVTGERRPGRIGVWTVRGDGREEKLAAFGVRVRHWISYHGLALNVAPDLSHYAGIVPCGIHGHGVTSLAALGIAASMAEVDAALQRALETRLGL